MRTHGLHRKVIVYLIAMLLPLAFGLPSYLGAEEPSGESGQTEVKLFKLKYVSAADARRMLIRFISTDEWEDLEVSHDEPSNTLFVRAPREQILLIDRIVREIDVLPQQMHIEIKLIQASKTGKSISPEIKGLTSKLQSLFAFSSYQLLDSIFLVAESGAKASLSTGGKYKVTCTPRFIDEGKGIIRLQDLKLIKLYQMSQSDTSSASGPFLSLKGQDEGGSLSLNIPNLLALAALGKGEEGDFGEPILTTSLNIKNGDTVIVGGSKVDGNDTVLITAVTARTTE